MRRKTKLLLPYRVGITEEVQKILSQEKKKQKKSMAEIVNELIKEKFNK